MRTDYDVMIAGGGTGGVTAAYELACRGLRVGIFEKQPLPRVKPYGGCLSLKIDRIHDGYVIYAFASAPAQGLERFYATLVERLMHASLRWRFLTKDDRPYHDCEHSRLITFARGLSTVVMLRKCCTVAAPVLPCLAAAAAARQGHSAIKEEGAILWKHAKNSSRSGTSSLP